MTGDIPVVDMAAASAGQLPADTLGAIREAITRTGAIQVVNHGIPDRLLAEFDQRMARLLTLPASDKAALASPDGHPYRGWRQWPDDFGRLEIERYNVAQFDTPEDARAAGVAAKYAELFGSPNVWPAGDPQLRPAAFAYLAAASDLAERVLGVYAGLVGAPPGAFSLGSPPHVRLTTNDYPAWTYSDAAPADPAGQHPRGDPGGSSPRDQHDKLLLLEHADDSALTILSQQGDYAGLQLEQPDGTWRTVPVIPGALQAFSGQLLTRWSNGQLAPARHRVVAGGTMTRRSTAVFCYPSLETVVAPLPGLAPTGPEPWQPVRVWDHVRGRVDDYLAEFGRPDQLAAWSEGRPYVAKLAGRPARR
jgi:isopenicillin N synthase-like dioxygenase